MPKDVAIIGGGLAGLSAACTLAEHGVKTRLFEAGSQLGGRARSVAVEFNDQAVHLDNGQHILLGAYRETLNLLQKTGVDESQAFMRLPLDIETVTAHGNLAFKYAATDFLPFPLNQLFGFLCCRGLSFKERIAVIRLLRALKTLQISPDSPLRRLLEKHDQSARVIQLLWEPLCLSALNTPIVLASSKVFFNVLTDAFASKTSSDMLLPRLDLSQILSQPMARYIRANQGEIFINERISNITSSGSGFLLTTKHEVVEASHLILACSPHRLGKIAKNLPKLKPSTTSIETYAYQPIYTIYLQYPSTASLPKPMIALCDTLSQWVFDRGAICGQKGLMAVIISAEGRHQNLDHETLASKIASELRNAFPQLKHPLWHQVIAEKRATFACRPNLPRPFNSTPYPNLVLAGDYTYADYPATIEGAVRSGINAANLITNR